MTLTIPATADSPRLSDLCLRVRPGATPLLVAHRPDQDAEPSECFANVQRLVSRNGGDLVLGWALWEWEGVLVEAECHTIWKSPSGELVDVTPQDYDASAGIFFLPDPDAPYDFRRPERRVENVRLAICPSNLVKRFLQLKHEIHQLEAANTGPGPRCEFRFDEGTYAVYETLQKRAAIAEIKITRRSDPTFMQGADLSDPGPLRTYKPPIPPGSIRSKPEARPNAPCPCGSGKKFKKCCRNLPRT